jgi:hypothetical protein
VEAEQDFGGRHGAIIRACVLIVACARQHFISSHNDLKSLIDGRRQLSNP